MAGALPEAELEATVVAAGFEGFEITWRKDVFGGAPQAGSAASFGTLGINFRARKPVDEQKTGTSLGRTMPSRSNEASRSANGVDV